MSGIQTTIELRSLLAGVDCIAAVSSVAGALFFAVAARRSRQDAAFWLLAVALLAFAGNSVVSLVLMLKPEDTYALERVRIERLGLAGWWVANTVLFHFALVFTGRRPTKRQLAVYYATLAAWVTLLVSGALHDAGRTQWIRQSAFGLGAAWETLAMNRSGELCNAWACTVPWLVTGIFLRACRAGQRELRFASLAAVAFIAATVNDALLWNGTIRGLYFSQFGFIVFALGVACSLLVRSGKLARDFQHAQELMESSQTALALQKDLEAFRRVDRERQEVAKRKDEFIAMLSHELRSPIAALSSGSSVLSKTPSDDARVERARALIERQTRHLARLVDDLVDVSRIERGRLDLQRTRCDLVEIVGVAVEDFRSVNATHAFDVSLPASGVWIDGDPVRLAQVVDNLLQNAVRYSVAGSAIEVRLSSAEGSAVLAIEDHGFGVDSDRRAHMFTPFTALPGQRGGLGLGLGLVKGLVDLHDGVVRCESEGRGRGSTFVVTLPLAEADADAPVPTSSKIRRKSGGKSRRNVCVLVIEDHADAAEALCDLLELSGAVVELARCGRDGVAAARLRAPALILCDLGLPDMDGYDVVRALRADPATAQLRIIALSGYTQPEDRKRALEAGFDDHIAKPVGLEALEALLLNAAA